MTSTIIADALTAAISAGATAGITNVAKSAISDGYAALRSLVVARIGHKSDVGVAIESVEAKPESEGRKRTLYEEVGALDPTADAEVFAAARSLLELVKSSAPNGSHSQLAHGTGIAQADRGSSASVTISGYKANE